MRADDVPTTLPAIPSPGADSVDAGQFRTALIDLLTDLATPRLPLVVCRPVDLTSIRGLLTTEAHPDTLMTSMAEPRLPLPMLPQQTRISWSRT